MWMWVVAGWVAGPFLNQQVAAALDNKTDIVIGEQLYGMESEGLHRRAFCVRGCLGVGSLNVSSHF